MSLPVELLGVRGSVPVPGPGTIRYGGNTSCIRMTASDGTTLILDAGTGIRDLEVAPEDGEIHILLTHLHLDHIQGLLFFKPFFDPDAEVVVWGPPPEDPPLRDMLARYLSTPLSPIEIRELPARVSFRTVPLDGFRIGSATLEAARVLHRGVTLGYRVSDGGDSVCYLPDHEPALGRALDEADEEWVSGLRLARGASLLIHDGQFADQEYQDRIGWGHSRVRDALLFAQRAEAQQVLLFHHDPAHDDEYLDDLGEHAADQWIAFGGAPGAVALAQEGRALASATSRPPLRLTSSFEGAR
jgi:phosphoribosyl 1,2-cyclic phosphodiesterase